MTLFEAYSHLVEMKPYRLLASHQYTLTEKLLRSARNTQSPSRSEVCVRFLKEGQKGPNSYST